MNKYLFISKDEKERKHTIRKNEFSPFEIGIPLLDISDETIEQIYYFRWQTYAGQIKMTPEGYVVTEFLPDVSWAGKYNTINCPAGHHFYEGRWLHNRDILKDYARFWFTEEAEPRKYSFWAADAILTASRTWGDYSLIKDIYEDAKKNVEAWEKSHKRDTGLFYQIDNYDGMEFSISGSGERPTINSYMYADYKALSEMAKILGLADEEKEYRDKADELRTLINERLFDGDFYKNRSEDTGYEIADVREEIGYIPWCFGIPEDGMSGAWKYLFDEKHFAAPYGPTVAERCHPRFMFEHTHMCLWNGPSWPFSTCQTITALGNLLKDYKQNVMTKSDYFRLLKQYASCHYIEKDGVREPWIDENLDPFTGEWLARRIMIEQGREDWDRGRDYNHSTFSDLVISGLAGIRLIDGTLEVEPLFGEGDLEYIAIDGVKYRDRYISVAYDKTGERYGRGKGLTVWVDGEKTAMSDTLEKITVKI